MRIYNPKNWFDILFQFHKSDTLRKLGLLILIIAFYTAIVAYWALHIKGFENNIIYRNLSQMHGLLGFALSLLLVFRTNTAYDRWWEGRKHWGALVNCARNLALKLKNLIPEHDVESKTFFARTISLYAEMLRLHLQKESTRLALDELNQPESDLLHSDKHGPNQVALIMYQKVIEMAKTGIITGEQLLFVNAELTAFTDICGACERIKNTPIPYSYSAFIKKFIFIYVMTLPFSYVYSMHYMVIPVVAFVFYVLASLELIAEEIEDPFGHDLNDLPLEKINRNIERHVHEILL